MASTHNIFFTIMRSALKQLMPFLSNKNRPLQKNTFLLSLNTKFLVSYRGLNFLHKNYLKFLLVLRQTAKPSIPVQFDAPMQNIIKRIEMEEDYKNLYDKCPLLIPSRHCLTTTQSCYKLYLLISHSNLSLNPLNKLDNPFDSNSS